MSIKNKVGRPLVYPTLELLQQAIDNYFESCHEELWYEQPTLDVDGRPTGENTWIQRLDREGKPIIVQSKPYTMAGLALALNTSRSTIIRYDYSEEYGDAIKAARSKCETYVEEGMLNSTVPATPAIFNLKNNYDWVDKTEIDQNTRATVKMDKITRDGKPLNFDIGEDPDDLESA